jgi:hypothetical protein
MVVLARAFEYWRNVDKQVGDKIEQTVRDNRLPVGAVGELDHTDIPLAGNVRRVEFTARGTGTHTNYRPGARGREPENSGRRDCEAPGACWQGPAGGVRWV